MTPPEAAELAKLLRIERAKLPPWHGQTTAQRCEWAKLTELIVRALYLCEAIAA